MVRILAVVATLAFALTASAAPNPAANADPAPIAAPEPQSCGGQAIPGSDCSFNDQCRSCRCRNHICQ